MSAHAGKPLSNRSMATLLRRMERGGLTVHGFRSTFGDWCAEATAHPREVAEQALEHALPEKVGGRLPARRHAGEAAPAHA
jgi:integrase